ncbi:MAG: NYN domain-containing protein [Patescibacteria group bacterium]
MNIAFIDGQNLHLGTKNCGWSVDHVKLRIYLKEKYRVSEAHYFLGFVSTAEKDLYDRLQKAGFILSFREHPLELKSNKKGNVDSDIIFSVMKKIIENDPFDKIFVISGDGDYKKMVDFLIKKGKFGKILFPNRKFASSLYMALGGEFFSYLEEKDVRAKIEYIHINKVSPEKKKAP